MQPPDQLIDAGIVCVLMQQADLSSFQCLLVKEDEREKFSYLSP